MKNNKGFTLVEILAAIVILGMLIIVAVPTIQNAVEASKNKIHSINVEQVVDAGKILGEEIMFCDIHDSTRGILNESYIDCEIYQNKLYTTGITVSVDKLLEHDYFDDPNNSCKGDITVSASDTTYVINVDSTKVDCSKS